MLVVLPVVQVDNTRVEDCVSCVGILDCHGVCNGDDLTCSGCDGVPNSGLESDRCGVCGGDNSTCIECDGVPTSGQCVCQAGKFSNAIESVISLTAYECADCPPHSNSSEGSTDVGACVCNLNYVG